MDKKGMLIFITIVLTIHLLVNLYIFKRGLQALDLFPAIKPYFIFAFIFVSASYIVARVAEHFGYNPVSEVLNWIGSFWFAAMLYFFLIILCIDIVRLLNYFFHFLPQFLYADYAKTKFVGMAIATVFVISLIVFGFINASKVRVKQIELNIYKQAGNNKELRIALMSDIHLGTLIGTKKLKIIVEKVNKLKPDIILLAGDVVDENIQPVIKKNMGRYFEQLQSKYGVFAITGNHEFIGGYQAAINYLEKHNVKFLQDTAICIDSSFWLAGRYDRDMKRFTGNNRKSLQNLLKPVDNNLPLILLDHQPFNLDSTSSHNVDIQLSGHTHNGQLFPFNLITRAIYKPDYGYRKINNTHFYVSCGIGTWGPPVRIGNKPEIVDIRLKFIE